MALSLTTIGLFCLAVYLILVGLAGLTTFRIDAKIQAALALIAGVCLFIGVFVTESVAVG